MEVQIRTERYLLTSPLPCGGALTWGVWPRRRGRGATATFDCVLTRDFVGYLGGGDVVLNFQSETS